MNKMKIVLLVLVLLLKIMEVNAQTYIKTNTLYWLGLLPNLQIETRISNQFTFQGEINASFWTIRERPMIGMQDIAEVRWYPEKAFKGFYVGGDVAFDCYKASKWNYWDKKTGIYIQNGVGLYLGITLGYQLSLAKRWNLDFFAGGGWHHGWYWGENKQPDGCREMYAPWNMSGEWIPYKIGITFGYRLTSEKRMIKKFEDSYYRHK